MYNTLSHLSSFALSPIFRFRFSTSHSRALVERTLPILTTRLVQQKHYLAELALLDLASHRYIPSLRALLLSFSQLVLLPPYPPSTGRKNQLYENSSRNRIHPQSIRSVFHVYDKYTSIVMRLLFLFGKTVLFNPFRSSCQHKITKIG